MSLYRGDYPEDATVTIDFNVFNTSGTPAALAGTLTDSVSVYKSGSTTAHTTTYTPAVLDSKTGVYRVTIDMSADAFFATGTDYVAILTGAGITSDSVSVVNSKLATWSCENRTALLPDASITANTFDTGVIATDEELATTFWAALTAANNDSGSFGELIGFLNTAHAEPTGAPAANETPLDKLAYIFAALRNKITVTSSTKTFFDDAGAALWTKALSDDGTTFTEAEGATPA